MNFSILRALAVCAALFVCLLAFSCGKGKPGIAFVANENLYYTELF